MNKLDVSSLFELNYILQSSFFENLGVDFIMPEDLKDTHIKALIVVKFAEKKITMKEVSQGLNMVKGAFTPVANRLMNYDFLMKEKCDKDKRVSYLVLTEKGDAFITSILDILLNGIQKKLSVLSIEEQEAYLAAVKFVLNTTKKIQNSMN